MAITSISRMQQRRGLKADLPTNLAEGEFGWCLDTQELYIGNGAGYGGNSGILTEHTPNDQLITNRFDAGNAMIQASVVRSLGSKLNDAATVKDFGAKGDGIADDAPAINAAIASLLDRYGSPQPLVQSLRVALRLPAGSYRLASPILLYPYVSLIGDGADKTVLLATDGMSCMMQTADGSGQTGANIGLAGAQIPTKIMVADMTLDVNENYIDGVHLDRYQGVTFERVKFHGNHELGTGYSNLHRAVVLSSIGSATQTYHAQFVDCLFSNFTLAIESDDPVFYTTIDRCIFHDLYRAVNLGESANYNGPKWTVITQSRFYNIETHAVAIWSSNPGITSIANSFVQCCLNVGPNAIYWAPGTSLNSSVGDVFDAVPGVGDSGSANIIFDPQQNNISTVGGITGPTGPGGGATGPTGPGGGATGPTGPGGGATGPTGPGGGATGPTGPAGGGGSGSGTVNSGTANHLSYYQASGTAISQIGSVTWNSGTSLLYVDGNAELTGAVTADHYMSTAPGTPTLTSGSDIVLTPAGSVVINGPVTLASHTVSELSSIVPAAGSMAYCTNETGGAVPAFYDGTNWRRMTDRAIVS